MTVVGEGVTHVAQSAGVVAFAVQPSIGVGAGLVRVTAAALAFEVAAVAAIVAAVFAKEAFVTGPSLDEGVVLDQALTVFGEDGGYPHGVVHGQTNEPAKPQVVLGLLHELAFRTNAVEHLARTWHAAASRARCWGDRL